MASGRGSSLGRSDLVRGDRVSSSPLVTPQTTSGSLVDSARTLSAQLGWLQPSAAG